MVVYHYHTDITGRYKHRPEVPESMPPIEKGQKHGWVKTNDNGQYFIYTVRPGTYPTRDEPAHVHLTVQEPNEISEYYIDDMVFDDDPLLTTAKRVSLKNRAGSGVVRLMQKDGLWVGELDIRLGLHIPDYPGAENTNLLYKLSNIVGKFVNLRANDSAFNFFVSSAIAYTSTIAFWHRTQYFLEKK